MQIHTSTATPQLCGVKVKSEQQNFAVSNKKQE